jgi:FtsH-binding integral membrane protein
MNSNIEKDYDVVLDQQPIALASNFVANVFVWMFAGLAITGVLAYVVGTSDMVLNLLSAEGGRSGLGWVFGLAPLAFILAMNFGIEKFSPTTLVILFIGFSAVMGISLSYIFLFFELGLLFKVFLITAGTFGIMALVGYTTKTDLTKLGSLLYMALIGLIIAMVVNYFMQSGTMDYIISCVGVLIFVGLTAYDVQKIKRIGMGVEYGSATAQKLTIMGATTLYLDFINLFLFLLRIFGSRD